MPVLPHALALPPVRPVLLLALLASSFAAAQTSGTCALGTAQADLATADLSARLFNTGSLFFGNTTNGYGYFVPAVSGRSPIFLASLWVGGSVGGDVRAAGAHDTPFQFWPGPLGPGAALPDPADCSPYDRIWLVSPADVAAYEAGGPATADLQQWPVGLGVPAIDAQGQPVPADSRDQQIDLAGGERPVLGGGPTAFWVMNDVGNARFNAGEEPLGVEVRVTAFAPEAGPIAFRQATLYRFAVVNRSSAPITDLGIGMYADIDLGYAGDDYVGTDTTRGMAFTYNGDDLDEGSYGYGTPPPSASTCSRAFTPRPASTRTTGRRPRESRSPPPSTATACAASSATGRRCATSAWATRRRREPRRASRSPATRSRAPSGACRTLRMGRCRALPRMSGSPLPGLP